MLTLLPLTVFQDAFKKRSSKTMDQFGDRRGSISVYENYSLPSSKSSVRRFSSYEELAPFFEQISPREKSPAPASSPSTLVKTRRNSVTSALKSSFRRRKSFSASSPSKSSAGATCNDLDAQIAKIKNQLAQLKSEGGEISRRVDNLYSSVDSFFSRAVSPQDQLYFSLRQERLRRTWSLQQQRASLSTPGLESISESSSEEEEEERDEQVAFDDYCKRSISLMSRSRPTSCYVSEMPNCPEEEAINFNAKEYCLLNNVVAPKAKSTPQLNVIRNDLFGHGTMDEAEKRLSVTSCISDSILITQQHLPKLRPLNPKCVS